VSRRRTEIGWALYDWANSAFATTVMAGLFPVFFAQYWAAGVDADQRTFWLGVASSASSLVVVVLAPLLGTVADRMGARKRLLFVFTGLGVLSTGALALVGQGQWPAAAILFTLGSIGFFAGTSLYDALIVEVTEPSEYDRVSALGYGLGYLGGGLLSAVKVAMTLKPSWFGFADAAAATRAAFVMVALWWALFSVPLFLWVREERRPGALSKQLGASLRQLRDTIRDIGQHRAVWMFLIAYWLYIDGVDTIMRMAVDYGITLGFPSDSLIVALLMVQFIGFPAAIAFGWLARRIGTRPALIIGIATYIGVTCWAWFLHSVTQFYLMAAVIGLVQGGVQALSRAYYARLIPEDKAGEFFGFYNMLGKFAAVLGPIVVGVVRLLTGDPRLSILALVVFFVVGIALLLRVPEPGARAGA